MLDGQTNTKQRTQISIEFLMFFTHDQNSDRKGLNLFNKTGEIIIFCKDHFLAGDHRNPPVDA